MEALHSRTHRAFCITQIARRAVLSVANPGALLICVKRSGGMKMNMKLVTVLLAMGCVTYRTLSSAQENSSSCHCIPDDVYGGALYDCKSKGLDRIPKEIGRNATTVDLRDNRFTELLNFSFVEMPLLKCLRIDGNLIERLEEHTFYGIPSLQILSLSNNNLQLSNNSYPQKVFSYLNLLKELYIGGNSKTQDGKYPDDVFVNLYSLDLLVVDAIQKLVFGPGFKNMTSLKRLKLNGTGVPYMYLYKNSFINTPLLQELDLTGCAVSTIDADAFKPMVNLTSLKLKDSRHLTLQSAIRSLQPLKGRHMTLIDFTGIYFRIMPHANLSNRILTKEIMEPLTSLCVEKLSIAKNFQIYMDFNALVDSAITSCLRYMDMSQNMFLGGSSALFLMRKLTNLEYVNISNQYRWGKDLTTHSYTQGKLQFYSDFAQTIDGKHKHGNKRKGLDYSNSISKCPFNMSVYLPPKIKVMDISRGVSLGHALDNHCLVFKNTQYIDVVIASFINLKNIRNYMIGLERVKHMDLSGSDFSDAIPSFFEDFAALEYLKLCNANLGQRTEESNLALLSSLKTLKHVVLSLNQLKTLPGSIFSNSKNLSVIILNGNLFQTIPSFLRYLPQLTFLDMSNNMLSYISSTSRQMLDVLNRKHPVTLKLKGNNFLCGCETLDFVVWLSDTRVKLDIEKDYFCVTDDGIHSNVSYINRHYMMVWRRCIGKPLFYVSLIITVIILFFVTLFWITITNKTKLMHFIINIAFGRVIKEPTRRDYSYDAYIGYCENDWEFACGELRKVLEEKFGLKLFLRDRDTHVAVPIADEIIRGVHSSWTSVLVLSQDFLEDVWMVFIIDRAIFETRYMPRRLIVLLVGEVDLSMLPVALLDIVPEENIIEISDMCCEIDVKALTSVSQIITKTV